MLILLFDKIPHGSSIIIPQISNLVDIYMKPNKFFTIALQPTIENAIQSLLSHEGQPFHRIENRKPSRPGLSAPQGLRAATTGEHKNGAISPELRSS